MNSSGKCDVTFADSAVLKQDFAAMRGLLVAVLIVSAVLEKVNSRMLSVEETNGQKPPRSELQPERIRMRGRCGCKPVCAKYCGTRYYYTCCMASADCRKNPIKTAVLCLNCLFQQKNAVCLSIRQSTLEYAGLVAYGILLTLTRTAHFALVLENAARSEFLRRQ